MAIRRIVIDHVLFVVEDFDANRRLYTAAPVPDARALALTALLVGQTLMVLMERSPGVPVWRTGLRGNRALLPLLAAILATLAAALYVPPLADLLRISPLPFAAGALLRGWPPPRHFGLNPSSCTGITRLAHPTDSQAEAVRFLLIGYDADLPVDRRPFDRKGARLRQDFRLSPASLWALAPHAIQSGNEGS